MGLGSFYIHAWSFGLISFAIRILGESELINSGDDCLLLDLFVVCSDSNLQLIQFGSILIWGIWMHSHSIWFVWKMFCFNLSENSSRFFPPKRGTGLKLVYFDGYCELFYPVIETFQFLCLWKCYLYCFSCLVS